MPRKIIEIEDIEPEQEKEVSKPAKKQLSPERIKQRLEMLEKGRQTMRANTKKRLDAMTQKVREQALEKQQPVLKPIPENIPEPIHAPDESFDIRSMIRDVVRSEMLTHTTPQLLLPSRAPRRRSRRVSQELSTDTESNIETKPIKPIRTHNKPLPPQVPIPQSKVELPVPLLKRPEYNIMQDVFGHSS